MDNSKAAQLHAKIGQCLLIGILISVVIVSIGGVYSLSLYGHESVYEQFFYTHKPEIGTLSDLFNAAYQLTPYGIVQLGVFALVLTQLLRVLLVGWYFAKSHDFIFTGISAIILLALIYSLFGHFSGL